MVSDLGWQPICCSMLSHWNTSSVRSVALLVMFCHSFLPFYTPSRPQHCQLQLRSNCVWCWNLTKCGSHISAPVHQYHGVCWAIETHHQCAALLVMLCHSLLPFYPLQASTLPTSALKWLCVVCWNLTKSGSHISASVHPYHGVCWNLAPISEGKRCRFGPFGQGRGLKNHVGKGYFFQCWMSKGKLIHCLKDTSKLYFAEKLRTIHCFWSR